MTSGYAAAITGTICLQTAGWVCPFAAFILTTAAFYVAAYGYCPIILRIYLNFTWGFPMTRVMNRRHGILVGLVVGLIAVVTGLARR